MWEHLGTAATVLMVLLNIGMAVIGFLLKLSLSRMELALAHTEKTLNGSIVESQRDTDDRLERTAREFGEIVAAMRAKVNEVELFCRDNYIRRDSFQTTIKELSDRLEQRLERMEDKIDRKT